MTLDLSVPLPQPKFQRFKRKPPFVPPKKQEEVVEQKELSLQEFEDYRKLVMNHDRYYQYSDDYRVWRAGEDELDRMQAGAKKHPILKRLYEAHYLYDHMCPKETYEWEQEVRATLK